VRAILVAVAILVALPFLVGFVLTLGYQWLRVSFARVRRCPHCAKQSLCFVEGLRPLVDGTIDASSMIRGYYECDRCGSHFRRTGRGPFERVGDEEWTQVLRSRERYRTAGL
jgi:hypothetical protein